MNALSSDVTLFVQNKSSENNALRTHQTLTDVGRKLEQEVNNIQMFNLMRNQTFELKDPTPQLVVEVGVNENRTEGARQSLDM